MGRYSGFKRQPQLIILVEVKELAEVDSAIEALANAIGKFVLYQVALQSENLDLPLFLAVSHRSYVGVLSDKIGQMVRNRIHMPLIVFDSELEEIVEWIP